jgi:lipoprotein-releasing system ATP-binding protein
LLNVASLTKEYLSPAGPLAILTGVDLKLERGEAVAVMGPSGSGKTTLLSVLGALERPTAGTVTLGEENPFSLDDNHLAVFRNKRIGFVFQDHCLLPQCTVLENVLIPTLTGSPDSGADARAHRLLDAVGLGARLEHLPAQLSGGEKQRVAIARSLIREPLLMLCDEPTGNLDARSAEAVTKLLLELHKEQRTILIVVTHSEALAAKVGRSLRLVDGRLVA